VFITTAFGAAVVLRRSAYIHPRLVRGHVKYAILVTVLVGVSGAQVRRESLGRKLNSRSKMSDGWSCRVISGGSIGGNQRYHVSC